jgi:hypothetical protein
MANRQRGEVEIAARGKVYTLALTTNGACEIENASGRLFEDICAGIQKYAIRDMRWLLWGALQEYHADEIKTPADAGKFIDDAGGLAYVWAKANDFLTANADTSTDVPVSKNGNGAAPDPPPAQAPNGTGSTLTPDASA